MPTHVVTQGEHLSGVAEAAGFIDISTVWQHPNNSDLRAARTNPHILYPGDSLFIPDIDVPVSPGETGRRHRFQLVGAITMLRLTLLETDGEPLANASCVLTVDGAEHAIASDADGKLDIQIAASARMASLSVIPANPAIDPWSVDLRVGDLDPFDTRSGQAARLRNLGYSVDPDDDQDVDSAFTLAIECFQQDQRLNIDGICGPVTQAKLQDVHGS